ncbi:hypothetical protein EPICR_140003 [Candidatus Desulfarcum epimagneticum]|uniref:Fibronectin type-III domain-containing protein n=1 Tax=uncultured Desulfobacteraceae bacterium TaxID=218296 RepID=A0A484HHV3_9BACT|nr:hypothetical protein EPICR_140003 [uncultured Desulfobacteraceae bacterium]
MIRTLKFNGVDNYIALGDSADVKKRAAGSLTIEAWIRTDPDVRQEWTAFAGALEDSGSNERGWALGIAYGRLAFGLAAESGRGLVWARADKDYLDGEWRHVAGVYDGETMRLYVDAELAAEAKNSGAVLYPDGGEFVIGAFKDSSEFYPFNGNIAEVRLWSGAKSRDAILVNRKYHLDPADYSDLVGYWPLIDGVGNVAWNWLKSGKNGDIKGQAAWEDRGGLTIKGHFPVPSPPVHLESKDIRDDRFTADWEGVSGAEDYILDVALDDDFENRLKDYDALKTRETRVRVKGLESGKTYFWRVSCRTSDDTGKPSGVQRAATRAFSIPDANRALSFPEDEANSSFIDLGKIEDVKDALPADAFTAEAWVRPDDFSDSGIFGVIGKDGDEKKGWLLGIKDKKFFFSVSGKDTDGAGESGVWTELVSKKDFMAQTWRHVAGVYSGKEMELYVDGERIRGTGKAAGAIFYPADQKGDFRIGTGAFSDGKSKSFKGMMAEIRLWSRALSGADIREGMEHRVYDPEKQESLAGCWPLCKGSGTAAADITGKTPGELSGRAAWADAGDLCLFWPLGDTVQTAAGLRHTLALKSDGTVWAWGANSRGQLGDGSRKPRYSPVMVKDAKGEKYLTGIKEIAAGHFHSAAVDENGRVWTWGDHSLCQLGNQEFKETSSRLPVRAGLVGVKSVSALGDFTLALKNEGTVWGWGVNDQNQLGNDKTSAGEKSAAPLQVKADNDYSHLEEIVQVSAGKHHGLALDQNGRIWTWGDNGKKQLTAPSTFQAFIVKDQDGAPLAGIQSIAAGMWHSLAVDESGQALAWGDNAHGQAGRGDETAVEVPKRVKDENGDWLSGVRSVSAGYDHSMAWTDQKTLAWGRNDHNQLGDGTGKDRPFPLPVKDRDGKEAKTLFIAGGKSHTAAVMPDGGVFAWGKNAAGQLGNGEIDAPHIISLGLGHSTTYVVKKDGVVWGAGWNAHNFLGDNSGKNGYVPVRILGVDGVGELENVKFVDGSIGTDTRGFAFAILESGRVCAWGANGYGQLGTGDKTSRHFPVWLMKDKENVFEENVIKVAGGEFHSALLTEDGAVYTWGHNNHGQLGLGNKTESLYPKKVEIEGAVDIITCEYNTFVLKEDGSLWGCGYNGEGNLGQNDRTHRSAMTRVPDLDNIVSLAGGAHHILALDARGDLWAWGYNHVGQVGNNSTARQLSPVRVVAPKGSPDTYLENIIAVSAGMNHSLAVKEDGTVWAWGENYHGRLGYAITGDVNQQLPGQVEYSGGSGFLLGMRAVFGGTRYSLALDEDGILWAWGRNMHGQCVDGKGDGKTETRNDYPVKTLVNE